MLEDDWKCRPDQKDQQKVTTDWEKTQALTTPGPKILKSYVSSPHVVTDTDTVGQIK